jgi:hypothetical protein
MGEKILHITLDIKDVHWAADSAALSAGRWAQQAGHYTNYLTSHFKGKLGELAVEKFLLEKGYKLDSHFRFADRENLSDIVIKVRGYRDVCRVEVKTWDARYWAELGRCIAVDQYEKIKKKADQIVWCVAEAGDFEALLKSPAPISIALMGWSWTADVVNAPVRLTGTDKMRKVENYQLGENDLHPMHEYKTSENRSNGHFYAT